MLSSFRCHVASSIPDRTRQALRRHDRTSPSDRATCHDPRDRHDRSTDPSPSIHPRAAQRGLAGPLRLDGFRPRPESLTELSKSQRASLQHNSTTRWSDSWEPARFSCFLERVSQAPSDGLLAGGVTALLASVALCEPEDRLGSASIDARQDDGGLNRTPSTTFDINTDFQVQTQWRLDRTVPACWSILSGDSGFARMARSHRSSGKCRVDVSRHSGFWRPLDA